MQVLARRRGGATLEYILVSTFAAVVSILDAMAQPAAA